MFQFIRQRIQLTETNKTLDLDHPPTTEIHAKIIKEKRFLRELYEEFYKKFLSVTSEGGGSFLELGSGGGFIKDIVLNVITSDILPLKDIDLCLSAEKLPFKDCSISGVFMFNVFHHIKDPILFLEEIDRCLLPKGILLMVEPANTLWGRFIYKNFHHESFDPTAGWKVEGVGPLSEANGALPWIVFQRDKEEFAKKFANLQIIKVQHHTPLRYLISGGFTLKQLAPSCSYGFFKGLEIILSPFNNWMGMFSTIKIKKV